jgi:hypothetical protein
MIPNYPPIPDDILITWVVKYCDRATRCALRLTCKPLREAVLKRAVRCNRRPGGTEYDRRLPVKSIADAPRVRVIQTEGLDTLTDEDVDCLVKAPMLTNISISVPHMFNKKLEILRNALSSKGVGVK